MDAVKRCTTADFLTPANENELPPFELQIEQVLRQKRQTAAQVELVNSAIVDQPSFGGEKSSEEDQPEKPHPLRSPVTQRPTFLRAYTISSVPESDDCEMKENDNNTKNTFGSVKLKFAFHSKGSAWKLEDEEEEDKTHGSTEGTPFVASGSYFANSVKPVESPLVQHRKLPTVHLNPLKIPTSKSHEKLARDGDSVHLNGKRNSSGKEDSPSPEGTRKHGSSSMQKGIVKLARRLSQKHSKGESRSTVSRNHNHGRSQSLEELPSPTSSRSVSVERINSLKSPKLHRTFSLNQRPSTPRMKENRLSSNAKDLREKQKKRKDNGVEALIDAVIHNDENEIRLLLETEEVDVNGINDEGFAALDFAVMLGLKSVVKLLQSFGAEESRRLHSSFLMKTLKMLLKEADERVDDLTILSVNASNSGIAETKENERSLKEWEGKQRLFNKMMSGLMNIEIPGKPGTVSLTVASESSLFVRFTEPMEAGKSIVTKFKIQCSLNEKFTPVDCEHVLYNLHSLEYTIDHLRKSVVYYVRVCCGNFKGFGPWLDSSPPCATPSSWHEVHDTKPRFQGRQDIIDDLFSRVWQSHDTFSPQRSLRRPHSTFENPTELAKDESTKASRRQSVKKSITKYTNIFFHSTPKFVKNLRRGVYLAAQMFTDDGKVLVTLDENLPIIEVDDSYPSSFQQDVCWLMKVACTWKDVKKLKQEVESMSSSTSSLFRCKLLQAADTMQVALGKQHLGQLNYKAIKDRNGSTIIVAVSQHVSSFKPRMLSLKWLSSNKLQKKMTIQPGLQADLLYASEMLITSVQDNIRYFKQSRRKLERGLYIGYLRLRSFVDAIHVVVHENSPNVLPHIKVRDNPNVSREEWQLLQSFDSAENHRACSSKTVREFHEEVARAAELLMEEVGVSKEAAQLHRIYDREVVELDENVSFLIVFPPPEDVCSAPGQVDSFSNKKAYISLPVQTFEMIHMFTYQRDFICHYSRLSSVLDMDAAIIQQSLREAFSSHEVSAAKERQKQLLQFQRELDDTWKGMRWILDALPYARDRQVRGGIPLAGVFNCVNFVCKKGCCPSTKDNGKCDEVSANIEEGILKVYCAFETGLAPGASVKLRVLPRTTAMEVVTMVVRELERIAQEKGKKIRCVSEDKLRDYCLVFIVGSHEKLFNDDYKPLQLQNPWTRGKLYIRLRSEALAASSITQSSSV